MRQPMNIRLSDTSRAALERLAAQQGFEKAGRGNVSGFLDWLGVVAAGAEAETSLLIDAAADLATGGDEWNTLAMLKPLLPPMTVTAEKPHDGMNNIG